MTEYKGPSPEDIYLFHAGCLFQAYKVFGAHPAREEGEEGIRFTVWAPHAENVGVVGDFNQWQVNSHLLQKISPSGIWSGFLPGITKGMLYKYAIHTPQGQIKLKADPYAFYAELRPKTASLVWPLEDYPWQDGLWLQNRGKPYQKPLNIYEVHLGSWRRNREGGFLNYRELARLLAAYAAEMGYTHLEILPLMEHPLDASWGYQVTGYYAATSRFGTPQDLMYFVDYLHQKGIGVILDWVPAHFCKDDHGLACFDGTPLYEGGESPEWGTSYFDLNKPEVVSFLISNAMFWFEVFHVDGLRLDAVASMLYLDYGKAAGEWQPNDYGGRENLKAVEFLQNLHRAIFGRFKEPLMIAEESTAWPLVTRPVYDGGLGFNYKWNMGWMNDVLWYMSQQPSTRAQHHHKLTFSLMYAFSENFILPLSHDEVVHGKNSLLQKMPGDNPEKFANLRLLLGYLIAHPGKKTLFMGGEIAQFLEWRHYEELDWSILGFSNHQNFQRYVRDLNHFYLAERCLWELDHEERGFAWIDADNSVQSILVFLRKADDPEEFLLVAANFGGVHHEDFRLGVPKPGRYKEVFNSNLEKYGGCGKRNEAALIPKKQSWQKQPYSLEIVLPPLSIVFLKRV